MYTRAIACLLAAFRCHRHRVGIFARPLIVEENLSSSNQAASRHRAGERKRTAIERALRDRIGGVELLLIRQPALSSDHVTVGS